MTQYAEVALAMDWGGTWSRVMVADRQGEILWQSRLPNVPGGSREQLIGDSEGLIRQAVEWCGDRAVAGLGVAAAGPVDAASGTLQDPPNLPALNGVSLKSLWEPTLGYPVYVGNDANLAALGEFQYGAGLEARRRNTAKTLVYVTVSTGIGAGVIDRGRMFLGAQGLAAEVGHMVIDRSADAPECTCGGAGCLEALASGTAIARIARRRVAESGSESSTGGSVLDAGAVEQITAETVFNAASQGDSLAQSIVEDAVQALAVGFTNLLHLYNPDLLVMGGGVTSGLVHLGLLPRINSLMLERAMSEGHKNFRLVPSRLGDTAGMLGAASLVWENADN